MIARRDIREHRSPMRGEVGAEELLRRVRDRVAAEVQRLERELSAFQDEWPRPPSGDRQRFATGGASEGPAPPLGGFAPTAAAARARLALMRQLQRAAAEMVPGDLHADWAGPGSIVLLEDISSGERFEYLLMPGDLADVAAGHVSLASPIGQAVLGRGVGATIDVVLPGGTRRYRVRSLTTLPRLVGARTRDLDHAAAPRGQGAPESGRSQPRQPSRPHEASAGPPATFVNDWGPIR